MECWQAACESYPGELVFNGDLFTAEQVHQLAEACPRLGGVMLGRGLVANPALARLVNGGAPLQKQEIIRFHDRMAEELQKLYQPNIVFMKLRIVMKHLECCFADTGKLEKQIRKSRSLPELLEIDRRLFETCALKPEPAFVPDELRRVPGMAE